jgi:hypothetical protein
MQETRLHRVNQARRSRSLGISHIETRRKRPREVTVKTLMKKKVKRERRRAPRI